jgi:glycosyltransferase involved in cell wall biosynthesis
VAIAGLTGAGRSGLRDEKRLLLIPAWNEARHLEGVLERARAAAPGFEIVVVDDGSTDATARVAAGAGARVVRHPVNLGYGAALQTGYKLALREGVDLLVQMDADGQHDPKDVTALAAPVLRGELDVAIGSRFLARGDYPMGALRDTGRRLFRWLARRLGLEVTDPTSGFQALSARALALYARDFFPSDYPDVDVLVAAHRSGLSVGEVPVEMAPGERASTLHGGIAPIYYVYKMLLSLWATAQQPAGRGRGEDTP